MLVVNDVIVDIDSRSLELRCDQDADMNIPSVATSPLRNWLKLELSKECTGPSAVLVFVLGNELLRGLWPSLSDSRGVGAHETSVVILDRAV